jgi:predicted dienelactone hydrolase
VKRALQTVAVMALAAGALGVLLVASIWHDHTSSIALPAPTGPFTVARLTDVWRDASRELVVWIWYPADPIRPDGTQPQGAAPRRAGYVPAHWREALMRRRGPIFTLLTRDPALVDAHSFEGAAVSRARAAWPVVILRGGLGALTTDYTTLAEDLASHGYVVAGFDAPGRTSVVAFPDGRVVLRDPSENPETVAGAEAQRQMAERLLAAWVRDTGFVVDRLEALNAADGAFRGRLDLKALGAAGHSLGGATAVEFCRVDARCRAAVDLDGLPLGRVVREGTDKPLMFLFSDHRGEHDPDTERIVADVRSIYDRLPPDARVLASIRGAGHFSFSDQMVVRNQVVMRMLQAAGVLRLEPRRGLAIAAACVRRFFDAELKGDAAARFTGPWAEYPEVQFDSLPDGQAR